MTTVLERAFSKQEEVARIGGAHRRRKTEAQSRKTRLWEIQLLALAALIGYIYAGYFLLYELNFQIGDALARTANAKYILFSRDAHAAALGFDWMPISVVSQLPIMLVTQPLGIPEATGFLSTALYGAGTVYVLGRLCYDLGLPRLTGFLLALVYASNPVAIYYAGNGMSEAPLFFFLALTMWGLLRFLDGRFLARRSSADLFILALGLAGAALSRYEALPVVFIVGATVFLADYRNRGRSNAFMSTALAVGPALWLVFLWFMDMKIIKGSFFAFREGGSQTSGGGDQVEYLQGISGDAPNAFSYTAKWVFAFFPAAVLLVPTLLVPPWRKILGGVALTVVGAVLPLVTTYLIIKRQTFGNPRYFTSAIIVGAIAVIWVASRFPLKGIARLSVDPVLIGLLAVGSFTGTVALQDAPATKTEGESRVFDIARGVVNKKPLFTDEDEEWRTITRIMDGQLAPGDLVLMDARYSFQAAVYSTKPKQLIINSDRDYEALVADPNLPGARIDYALVPPGAARGRLVERFDDSYRIVTASPDEWQPLVSTPVATLYKRLPVPG